MIAWLIAHPLARKLMLYAGITLGILYALRWWGNRQWSEGEAAGRLKMSQEIERRKKAEWEAREKKLAAIAEDLDEEKGAIRTEKSRLSQERQNLSRSLSESLNAIREERTRQYENVAAVDSADLDGALRAVSAELAAHR